MVEMKIIKTDLQAIVTLGEKLTAAEISTLKNEVKLLLEEGINKIEFDCTHLDLLDSTGIGFLVAVHNSLSKVSGSVTINKVSADIYDLLCSMRLDRHIHIIQQSSNLPENGE